MHVRCTSAENDLVPALLINHAVNSERTNGSFLGWIVKSQASPSRNNRSLLLSLVAFFYLTQGMTAHAVFLVIGMKSSLALLDRYAACSAMPTSRQQVKTVS